MVEMKFRAGLKWPLDSMGVECYCWSMLFDLNSLSCLFLLISGDVRCEIIGERGNSITLNPLTRGNLEEVTWTHNGNTVVEYDQQQILIFDPFKKRVVLDLHTGALTINKLNAGDDGVYESQVVVSGKKQHSKHDLRIIGK